MASALDPGVWHMGVVVYAPIIALSITHNFCELVGAAHGAGSG